MRHTLQYLLCFCFVSISSLQAAWTTPENVEPLSFLSVDNPHIAVDPAGNATAIWEQGDGSNERIFASTKPYGHSWQTTPDTLSLPDQDATAPQITVDSLHKATTAVWHRFNGSYTVIQASTKLYNDSWQASPDTLSPADQDAQFPQIAVDSLGNATAVWYQKDGSKWLIKTSTKPYLGTWQTTPDTISTVGQNSYDPQLAIDSLGNITVVWRWFDGAKMRIQASTKPHDGSWQTTPDTISLAGQDAIKPQITVDSSGNVTAVWVRSDGASQVVQVSTKTYGGSWQTTPDTISVTGQDALAPQIVSDAAGNITVAWYRSDGSNTRIQASTKPYNGGWQGTPDEVSIAGQNALNPQLAVDGSGNVTVVWGTSAQDRIQASTKLYGGSWQTTPSTIAENVGAIFKAPDIAVLTPANVVVIWSAEINSEAAPQVSNTLSPDTPSVTGIIPTSGSSKGGTTVTITGTNFVRVTGVTFGEASSTFTIVSPTSITASSPAGSPGVVDIRVTNYGGTSAISGADQFTYQKQEVLKPPRDFRGHLTKRSASHKHRYRLDTKWKRSHSHHVVSYRVYERSHVVARIRARAPLTYKTYLRSRSSVHKFWVDAVNTYGRASSKRRIQLSH